MRMPDSMKWQMMWKLMTAKDKDQWGGLWGEWRCGPAAGRGACASWHGLGVQNHHSRHASWCWLAAASCHCPAAASLCRCSFSAHAQVSASVDSACLLLLALIMHTSAADPATSLCREQYEYVMVADDDLIMDACVINTVFEVSS